MGGYRQRPNPARITLRALVFEINATKNRVSTGTVREPKGLVHAQGPMLTIIVKLSVKNEVTYV